MPNCTSPANGVACTANAPSAEAPAIQLTPDTFATIAVKLAASLEPASLQTAIAAIAPMLAPQREPAPAPKPRRGWPRGKPEAEKPRPHTTDGGGVPGQPLAVSASRELRPCEIRKRLPRAVKFLRSALAAGGKAEGVVRASAAEARIRPEVLTMAIDELGVLQRKPENSGELLWRLPA